MTMIPVIGIDLGTTYSCVAYIDAEGKPKVIEIDSTYTMPSMVGFTQTERMVGHPARGSMITNYNNTVYSAKRLIGRRFDDKAVQADIPHWPFTVINECGKPKIKVSHLSTIYQFDPEQISCMVLEKLKHIAQTKLGREVVDAVITVPAYFNQAQREATINAGKAAGLNVLRIINEPTAAALAYGLDRLDGKDSYNILVYDLGGGTFDVSILTVVDTTFEVKASAGDSHLGGEDFDSRMVKHLADEYKQEFGKDLFTTDNKKKLLILREACEKAKRYLSDNRTISIPFEDHVFKMTRAEFNELCDDLFYKTLDHVEDAVKQAKLTKDQIDDIILVGGSTRIPKVQELLKDMFPNKSLIRRINPDEVVACGAALQAAILTNTGVVEKLKNVKIQDVTPLSLGTNIVGGRTRVIVPRNTPLPARFTKQHVTARDNQTYFLFKIVQGERPLVEDNLLLGKFTIEVPKAPKREAKALLTFEVDENSILTATAKVESTGLTSKHVVMLGVSNDQADKMIKQAEDFRLADLAEKKRVDALCDLEDAAKTLKSKINNNRMESYISSLNKTNILNECEAVIEWKKNNPRIGVEQAKAKLEEFNAFCHSILKD